MVLRMINNDKMLELYFKEKSVNNIFKILPLYEEQNDNLHSYVSSLTLELCGLQNCISSDYTELITLIAVLSNLENESLKDDNKSVIKREVFKAIDISKSLSDKMVN